MAKQLVNTEILHSQLAFYKIPIKKPFIDSKIII